MKIMLCRHKIAAFAQARSPPSITNISLKREANGMSGIADAWSTVRKRYSRDAEPGYPSGAFGTRDSCEVNGFFQPTTMPSGTVKINYKFQRARLSGNHKCKPQSFTLPCPNQQCSQLWGSGVSFAIVSLQNHSVTESTIEANILTWKSEHLENPQRDHTSEDLLCFHCTDGR
ncbi:hypothetical protein E5288_WYG011546 [Bos mutus]|uniref:Uncharacterized protein n=1 Tax=Bos mutus TaxID=72004 RepID=A0A6B0RPE9_9CETA|nr:hypothetical protein [Bos mutus]